MNLVTEAQINQAGQGLLNLVQANNHSFDGVHSPGFATPTSLVFISSEQMLIEAVSKNPQGFIILEKNFLAMKGLVPSSATVWTTSNIQHAMTKILILFDRKNLSYPTGIHPTAIIHATATVEKSAAIGPYVVIQQGARIGSGTIIGSHSVIEAFAVIEENTLIYPHVFVGSFCTIGKRCIISPHVTIGSDGFGFFTDKNGHHKIPQIGHVVIEDDCEIGGNCVIDRATLEQTTIKKGSKLDNLCHIAHNVEIGEQALLAAAFKTAGSTKFGKNLMTAGNVDINGHIEICDHVILTGRTGVISSIKEPGMYGGFPAENHRDNIKTMISLSHLAKLRKNVQKILKHLHLEDTKEPQE